MRLMRKEVFVVFGVSIRCWYGRLFMISGVATETIVYGDANTA